MPFTPLHMGTGMAIKAIAGRHCSLLTFGVAQVAMDIEPLIGLLRNADVLHGVTHTYLAACFMALLVALIAPPLCRPILRRWNQEMRHYRLPWLCEPETFARLPVMVGAFSGTLSHVLLDSIMHADASPLAPWSSTNGLLGLVSVAALHELCGVAAQGGLIVWLIQARRKRGA